MQECLPESLKLRLVTLSNIRISSIQLSSYKVRGIINYVKLRTKTLHNNTKFRLTCKLYQLKAVRILLVFHFSKYTRVQKILIYYVMCFNALRSIWILLKSIGASSWGRALPPPGDVKPSKQLKGLGSGVRIFQIFDLKPTKEYRGLVPELSSCSIWISSS